MLCHLSSSLVYVHNLIYRSGHIAQVRSVGFMHANKSSDLLAWWWTLDKATRSRTNASPRPASEEVSTLEQVSDLLA